MEKKAGLRNLKFIVHINHRPLLGQAFQITSDEREYKIILSPLGFASSSATCPSYSGN